MILDHMECQNKWFWRILSSWWPVLALLKSQNALKMECFATKNGSKMGQKKCFSRNDPKPFGVPKQVEWSHFEPMLSYFSPSQGRKGLENGPIWDHKWLKNGSKPWFSTNDSSLVVVPKRMNIAHFEPLLSRSHPLSIAYLICG